ncbi:MAG: alpha/beta hydrolase [Acidobacteriota bacterium]
MNPHRFPASRLGLDRSIELGMAVRRRRPESPRGTLVYIHGLGESGLCFESVMCDPRLDAWDHLAIDLIGYGRSVWGEQPLGLEQHAASIELVLDRLGIDRAVLLGHSMGSVIAVILAERGRITVDAVLDIEGNVTLDDCTFSGQAAAMSTEKWCRAGYGDFLLNMHVMANEGEKAAENGDDSKERAPVMRAYAASCHYADPRTFHLDAVDLVQASGAEELAARRSALSAPVTYFYGASRGTGEKSLGQLKDAGIPCLAFEPAGHWLFLDQPAAFIDSMVEALDAVPAPAGAEGVEEKVEVGE